MKIKVNLYPSWTTFEMQINQHNNNNVFKKEIRTASLARLIMFKEKTQVHKRGPSREITLSIASILKVRV